MVLNCKKIVVISNSVIMLDSNKILASLLKLPLCLRSVVIVTSKRLDKGVRSITMRYSFTGHEL